MSVLIKKDEKEKDKQTKDSIKFEMNNKTIQEEYYLPNYANLTTNNYFLKIFAKQFQNLYNFVRLHICELPVKE